uniref:Transposase n=1 Tax=Ascaris lumbricoides TaxID=6252 RepID=A0A0M3HLC5_ASCLU
MKIHNSYANYSLNIEMRQVALSRMPLRNLDQDAFW